MKSLFLVNSPLEMISAIEARKHFKIENTYLLLYISNTDKKVINYLIQKSDHWNTIKWLSRKSYYGVSWIRLIKRFKKEKFDYFFMPIGNLSAHFLFNLNYKKYYFLDDGTYTLTLLDFFIKNKDISKKMSLFEGRGKFGFKYDLIEKLHLLFGHKFRINKKMYPSFFTFFELKDMDGLEVVKNDFKWFQSFSKDTSSFKKEDNIIYIIGSALVTDKIISMDYYIKFLNKIKNKFPKKDIVYILHRRETSDQIKKIKQQTELNIKKNKYIIEIDFFMNEITPTHVVSYVSTALFTLKKLYNKNIQIDSFLMDINEINKTRQEDFKYILNQQNKYVDNVYE